jgi:predicted nucleic acid-binding protein
MVNKAVSDTGPILHLYEINLLNSLEIFSKVFIPDEVFKELHRNKVTIPNNIEILSIKPEWKDSVKILTNQHNLDLGESQAIALAMQLKADFFITDDLDARNVAKNFNLEVHGTLGIILRSFRDKIIDKDTALNKVRELYSLSTLFITSDLIEKIIKEINNFSRYR